MLIDLLELFPVDLMHSKHREGIVPSELLVSFLSVQFVPCPIPFLTAGLLSTLPVSALVLLIPFRNTLALSVLHPANLPVDWPETDIRLTHTASAKATNAFTGHRRNPEV